LAGTNEVRSFIVRRKGFTLMEVLLAAVILAVGLTAALESLRYGLSACRRAARKAHGHALGAEILNRATTGEIRSLPASDDRRIGGVVYTWRVRRGEQAEDIAQVVCEVKWAARGAADSLTLERWALLPQEALP
jgi:prepilin-type N-terminal cleavage/methylation domain-containing protein